MRSLICTFGFDDRKIIDAMRSINHDEMIIVTGVDNTQLDAYLRLVEICNALRTPVRTITIDVFNFAKSFETMIALIRELRSKGNEVQMNISGGLPLLSDAALLAAFNEGVVSYYVDEKVMKLPVLKNVTIGERLTSRQKEALKIVGSGIEPSRIDPSSKKDTELKSALLALKTLGLIKFEEGVGKMVLTKEGETVRDWIDRTEKAR
ncbi:MAG: hypothetical protein HPY73_07485 [Methanomassiliicoccales archaeon]|nr:MAG: hypothetical protein HPY73_07485 [Methanomassiliicoccales archaeon]